MKFIHSGYGRNVRISIDSGVEFNNVFGGVLNMRYDGSTFSLIVDGFSADPTVPMAGGDFGVTRTDSTFLGTKGLHAGYLTNKYGPMIFGGGSTALNRNRAMSLQVALWEILTETSSTYDVDTGIFRAQNSDGTPFTTEQLALIDSMINDFGQQAATYYKAALDGMKRPVSQSIITPVPEPMTLGILGLGAAEVMRRRRMRVKNELLQTRIRSLAFFDLES